jgi:hypothetical protein
VSVGGDHDRANQVARSSGQGWVRHPSGRAVTAEMAHCIIAWQGRIPFDWQAVLRHDCTENGCISTGRGQERDQADTAGIESDS